MLTVVNLHAGYGLSEVLRLKPVTWQWKNNPAGGTQLGMVAQEVEPLIPELVIHDPDPSKPLTMNYLGFLPIIVRAVQQQQEQIKEQQNEIENLKKLVCLDHPGAKLCKRKD